MASTTFRRVEFSHSSPLHIAEHDLKELTDSLGEYDVLVKVHAAALNPIDIILKNTHSWLFWSRSPKGLGRDFAGDIIAKGSKIDKFEVGDHISGIFHHLLFSPQGSLSEYLKIDTRVSLDIGKFPLKKSPSDSGLTYEEAASFNLVFGTAFATLIQFKNPDATTRALVIGGGTSVAWYVIQLLKNYYGVEFVASINSPNSSDRVTAAGADAIIDYTKGHTAIQVLELVKESGKQFDLIIDTVGNKELFPILEHILKPKSENSGYVTNVGDSVLDYRQPLNIPKFLAPMFRLLWPLSYNYSSIHIHQGVWYDFAIKLFEEGKLKTNVHSVYPLDDFEKAIDELSDHKAKGKIVVKVTDDHN